eukprot:6568313-Pyramimonas_sp.AAC.1
MRQPFLKCSRSPFTHIPISSHSPPARRSLTSPSPLPSHRPLTFDPPRGRIRGAAWMPDI